jgi:fucose permease
MTVPRVLIAAAATLLGASALQGLCVVSFPASATLLKQQHHFTDAQYGALFLPQVALTIAGSVAGGTLDRRLGARRLLALALGSSLIAELLLAVSVAVSRALAFPLLLAGAGFMGLGFGLSAAPLNGYPARLFPARASTALMAVHTAIGLGFALGPLAAGRAIEAGSWPWFPRALALLAAVLAVAVFARAVPDSGPFSETVESANRVSAIPRPHRARAFWAFAAIAVLYAFAEGTLANWVVIFLHEERKLGHDVATLALSTFWAAIVAGRLVVTGLVTVVPARRVWTVLFALVALALLLVPAVHDTRTALVVFAFAGFAFSACFPLTVALASERFPRESAWVASMMIAALMLGVGVGSFAIGAVRDLVPLVALYRLSAAYPALALLLVVLLLRQRRPIETPNATPRMAS